MREIYFDSSAIELIAGLEQVQSKSSQIGRPKKWDWEGALISVIGLANRSGGIGKQRGEQAKIESAMADWFVETTGEQPGSS